MNSLLDVAWVLDDDPDPGTTVHRVNLTNGRLICATWVTHTSGYRIPDDRITEYGQRCQVCWPDTADTLAN